MENPVQSAGSNALSFLQSVPKSAVAPLLKKLPLYRFIYWDVLLAAASHFPMKNAARKIKARGKIENEAELVDFCFSCQNGLFKPLQVKEEIVQLLSVLKKQEIRRFMEIGTASGGTLFLFCNVVKDDALGISMDLPPGKLGGGYPMHRISLYREFARGSQKLHFLKEDSHDSAAVGKVNIILGNEKLDYLFIDGDHSYEGVRKDFEMYSSFVRKGGVIAFHDIAVHPAETGCEVNRFWGEMKKSYKYQEIINDRNQGGYGIGVLFV